MSYSKWKGIIDRVLAVAMLFFVFPVLMIVAILIKLEDPSAPVIFKQLRLGENEQVFTLFKFRSMRNQRFEDGRELSDVERMSRIGEFLRKTSIDELPQLLNIIKGEMSFIGPRPLPHQYLPYYTERENLRHKIKPGISGWAQVNGRNNVLWEEKFDLDLFYIENISFKFDIKIVLLTITKVFSATDIVETREEINQNFVEYRMDKNNG